MGVGVFSPLPMCFLRRSADVLAQCLLVVEPKLLDAALRILLQGIGDEGDALCVEVVGVDLRRSGVRKQGLLKEKKRKRKAIAAIPSWPKLLQNNSLKLLFFSVIFL